MTYKTLTALIFLPIMACTAQDGAKAPTMSVEEATLFCRAEITEATTPKNEVAIGVGVSGGKVSPRASVSIGIDVTSDEAKQKRFENCVIRNSGQAPSETFKT